MTNQAYLILGSNINPDKNIPKALRYLRDSFTLIQVSSTWRTKSIGAEAPDFYNTAAKIETGLNAYLLKEQCLCHIEEVMGRVRLPDKNAPRTIDIDIVIFNNEILDLNIFSMEHLALPLADLLPLLPDQDSGITLQEIASNFQTTGIAKNIGMILPG
jgi:2-amino-4-hydroxy-6-hydroxymethyldihydropteridine diphosphokinase